ncbi:MAG: cobalt-precorrin 5A hydrolase [Deltaproteobacteria bacterium]|nr:MAG: cobalt-precorrin 5A hydrolase [Deltaproteobacteria bacterium]
MNLAIVAITRNGARLGARLLAARPDARLFVLERFAADAGPGATPFSGDLRTQVARLWADCRGFAFIMATGIVVRMVAPHLAGKGSDPAVVVLDEAGRFAISLVAGHLGGANRLAVELAAAVGGTPVLTTATDVNGLTAWDEAARQAGLRVEPLAHIKHLNSLLLEGGRIALVDRRGRVAPLFANTPGIEAHATFAAALQSGASGLVFVTHRLLPDLDRRPNLLALRPPDLVVGIGCNRGTRADEIEAAVAGELGRAFLAFASVGGLASIRDKADEPGLVEFAARHALPLTFFTAEQLNAVAAPSAASRHALEAVGARGVCEPAAILAAGGGPLLITKKKSGNVTVAVAERID